MLKHRSVQTIDMYTKLELYQRIVSLAGLGIWEHDLLTGAIYWNSIIREILEVNPDFQPAIDGLLAFYSAPEQLKSILERVRATGVSEFVETELRTAKGNLKNVKITVQSLITNGVCTKIFGTLEDITAQVNTRRKLKEHNSRFYQAFTHAPIGMALVSLTGGWIKVNHSLCVLLGYQEQEFLSLTFQQITHPEDLDRDLEYVDELINGHIDTYEMEKRYFHKKGNIIWALLKVSAVRNDQGEPLYFVSQIKDITEEKRHIQIIQDQNNRLINFAHIVSHNLRSHSGNIQVLTDLALQEEDQQEQKTLLTMLNQSASNLLATLSDLNEIVKIQEGSNDHIKEMNLRLEVLRVIDILSGFIKQSDARLTIDIAEDIVVHFNPAYLESVFMNLITNSIRYRDQERPLLIKITAEKTSFNTIIIFSDNGIGIDLELYGTKLFGMQKTFHGNGDARGVGLFLVKNQVEAMGGKIFAESVPGVGTTFTLQLSH
jgi:PAS domain S-box-containing protein